MINKIKLSLKNKLELRLAEVFWLLSNDGAATSQEIAKKLDFPPMHHIQIYLSVLKSLGTVTEEDTNYFFVSSPQRAKHLHWLLQYQAVCQRNTNPMMQFLGTVQKPPEARCIAQWSFRRLESILLSAIFLRPIINRSRPLVILMDEFASNVPAAEHKKRL